MFASLACVALHANAASPHGQGGAELRFSLQQYQRSAVAAPPRQLSPDQRAELRRQLSEFRQPVRRQP